MLWTLAELVAASGAVTEGAPPPGCTGVSIDTRSLQPGDLFVALTGDPGTRFQATSRSGRDGHDFLEAAVRAGAAAALVHRMPAGWPGKQPLPLLRVEDTLDALWALGRHRRAALSGTVVAVTGSSGKTTAKSLLAAALGAWAEPGSLNNHLGVPLSLARTPAVETTAVYEIGTNHPGEIGPLARLVRPDVAIVLNVQTAHIGNFPGRAGLMREKFSIGEGLSADGVLVYEHGLDPGAHAAARQITFGDAPEADIKLCEVAGHRAVYEVGGRRVEAHVPGGGAHRARSLAAVLATLVALGRDLEPALALSDALIPGGRGVRADAGGVQLIDDSYNANPGSMQAALLSLQTDPAVRRFAALGEMLELGDSSTGFHSDLAAYVLPLTGFWAVGEGMRVLVDLPNCLGWHATAGPALLEDIAGTVGEDDVLLVKGSNRIFWAQGFVATLASRLRERTGH